MRKSLFISNFVVLAVAMVSAQLAPHPMGEPSQLKFKTEAEDINLLTGSLIFITVYDDNLLLNNAHKIDDVRYEIKPGASFVISRAHLHWRLGFNPTLTLHQQVSQRDLFTGAFGTDFKYDITQHFMARIRDNFVISSNPLYEPLKSGPSADLNLLDQPNETTITSQNKYTSNLGNADLIYQLGPRTTVQASGSFYNVSFQNLLNSTTPNGAPLSNGQSTIERAIYSYRVSRRNSIGVIYNFQDLVTFRDMPTRTVSHSFLYSHTSEITPAMTVEFFGGPERSLTHDHLSLSFLGGRIVIPFTQQAWSWAGGGMYGWQGNHTSFRASFRHEIANGGGLPTAAHNTRAGLEVRRELARNWTASANCSYGANKLIIGTASGSSTRMLSGGMGIRRRLLEGVFASLYYSHGNQRGEGELANRTGDVNLVSGSLEYQFKEPLGR